ncbi:hypothetical protein [Longimicrobium sp.]|uniref:hypothetical protein n=1 Tax=Longimicrobium sp. TaxID=2029185 RepID=UPI003B3BE60C
MIHRTLPLLAITAALAATSAAAQESPFQTRACPVPAALQGYPVWARAADGTALDSAWTRSVADAVARRWEPPSRRRASFPGLSRLRERVQPPEPRWPDDWAPSASHVARVEVTLRRGGRPGEAAVTAPSGDRAFDRTLPELFREGAPGSPDLPALPAGLDSVRLVVGFGVAPEEGAGAVRFAAQQSPLQVVPGTLTVNRPSTAPPAGPPLPVTVKYDVDAAGRVLPGSIQVLEGSDRSMTTAVQAGLLRARFTPAQSNCRAVTLSAVQQFGGR